MTFLQTKLRNISFISPSTKTNNKQIISNNFKQNNLTSLNSDKLELTSFKGSINSAALSKNADEGIKTARTAIAQVKRELKAGKSLKEINSKYFDKITEVFEQKYEKLSQDLQKIYKRDTYIKIASPKIAEVIRPLPKGEIPEFVYHGTSATKAENILKNGFDRLYKPETSGIKKAGNGIYFSPNYNEAASYSTENGFLKTTIKTTKVAEINDSPQWGFIMETMRLLINGGKKQDNLSYKSKKLSITILNETVHNFLSKKYDAVMLKRGNGNIPPEFIVYNPKIIQNTALEKFKKPNL
jgi:hypothetical protein